MFLLGPPPFFWSGLSQETVVQRNQQQFSGGLVVEYDSITLDEDGIATMTGNVKATYDVTELRCQELRVDQNVKELTAKGRVELIDPDGYLSCEELWATWNKPPEGAGQEELDAFVTGRASNGIMRVGNARFEAGGIVIHPGLWEMTDVHGTISSHDNAPYGLFARRVLLRPGKSGVAERLYLEILGRRIGPIPRYAFSMNKRVMRIGLPTVRLDQDKGLGVGWAANRMINEHSAVYGGFESFPGVAPKFGLEYAYSPLTADVTEAKINPRSDLAERAAEGWFDNIDIPASEVEQGEFRTKRLSYSIGTRWNEGTTARLDETGEISKQIELVYEQGGEVGSFGTFFQARMQRIRDSATDPFVTRALLQGTVLAPDYQLGGGLSLRTRADVFFTQSDQGTYSWLRGSTGLLYKPNRDITIGAAYVGSFDAGSPDFLFDPLYSKNAAHFRIDWRSGPYSVKYLYKYDFDRGAWYDREWEVSLIADAFEPFVQSRQFPGDYKVGIRFRIDQFIDKVTDRDPGRKRRKD